MGFTPTYESLAEGQEWKNDYYTQLVADLDDADGLHGGLRNLDGSDFADERVYLNNAGQDLDGGTNAIHKFKRWMGHTGGSGGAEYVPGRAIKDVTGFGAVGDGITDDTTAFRDAVSDLPSTGGIILVPPGTYRITDTIGLTYTEPPGVFYKNDVAFIGFGDCSKIIFTTSLSKWMFNLGYVSQVASRVYVANLRFDGGGYATNNAIDSYKTSGVTIYNCSFENLGYALGVLDTEDILINNCRFVACSRAVSPTTGWGSYHANADRVIISACKMLDMAAGTGVGAEHLRDSSIRGCYMNNVGLAIDIAINASASENAAGIAFIGNILRKDSSGGLGIRIKNNVDDAARFLHGITILRNYTERYADGIILEAKSGQSVGNPYLTRLGGIGVTGNVMEECIESVETVDYTSATPPAYSSVPCHGISIAGNAFNDHGITLGRGIRINRPGDAGPAGSDPNGPTAIFGNSLSDTRRGSGNKQNYSVYLYRTTLPPWRIANLSIAGNTMFNNTVENIKGYQSKYFDDMDLGHNPGEY